jgi:pilus assembly protein FimV
LCTIAANVKPEGVSLKQMLVAILRSNPDAFIKNNINRMKAGAMLRVPDLEQLTAMTPQDAENEIQVQTAGWNRYRQKLAGTAGMVSKRKTAASRPDKVSVKDNATEGRPVLRLSPGEPPGGAGKKRRSKPDQVQVLEEELIARERALNEANQRLKELQRAVKDAAK